MTSSISAQKGRSFLFKVDYLGTSPQTFTTLTGLRQTQLRINGNQVDVSNKSSAGFQELLTDAGIRHYDMTCAGIFDASLSGVFAFIHNAALNNTLISAQIVYPDGTTFTGQFVISDFTTDGPYDNAQTFSLTLMSHGTMVKTP